MSWSNWHINKFKTMFLVESVAFLLCLYPYQIFSCAAEIKYKITFIVDKLLLPPY